MNTIIARIRYRLINKPRKKTKPQRCEVPYVGPAQFLWMKNTGVMK